MVPPGLLYQDGCLLAVACRARRWYARGTPGGTRGPGAEEVGMEPRHEAGVVQRLKDLDARGVAAAFQMGDLLLEEVPMGRQGKDEGIGTTLGRLAEQSGVEVGTLEERRAVAHRIPPAKRVEGVPWTAYKALAYHQDTAKRLEVIEYLLAHPVAKTPSKRWTLDAVLALLDKAQSHGPLARWDHPDATPQDKAAGVVKVLADPAIVEAAVRPDSPVARALETLHEQVTERRLEEMTGEPTVSVREVEERIK